MKTFKKLIAEFLGTFFLVFFACGIACVIPNDNMGVFSIVVALGFGLALIASIYTIGNISGSHINPAVSIAMLIDGRMKIGEFIGYVISQFLGAIAGAALLAVFVPATPLGTNSIGSLAIWQAIIIEVVLTCLFVYTVLCTTAKADFHGAGIVNGFALTLVHILGISFTGTSVNPARTFGPAFIKMLQSDNAAISQYWVFLVAPLAGGILAALIYKLLHKDCCCKKN
ncbi:MAG: aquaporin [Clostridiales bacterium]|nr:aquaporin [Clostridiales bacterium]